MVPWLKLSLLSAALLCPKPFSPVPPRAGELPVVSASPAAWMSRWLSQGRVQLKTRSAKPPPVALDVGEVAVIVDDGTVLEKTSDNGSEFGGPTFLIDDFAAARAFYRTHGDRYDSLIFFMQEQMDFQQGFAHGHPVDNKTRGIGPLIVTTGDKVVDFSPAAGSRGNLQGIAAMNCICFVGDDPSIDFFGDYTFLDLMAQEWGHKRLTSALVIDPDGELSSGMLGRDLQHWSFFAQSFGSPLEGSSLSEGEPNLFESLSSTRPLSTLDLYLLGYAPASQVEPFFFVDQVSEFDGAEHDRSSAPEFGPRFFGRRRDLTVDNVIAANGPRSPAPNEGPAPVQERHAFVLLVPQGSSANPQSVAQVDAFRAAWEAHFSVITGGKAEVDTSLEVEDVASLPPVGVLFARGFGAQGESFSDTISVLHAQNLTAVEVVGGGVTATISAVGADTVDVQLVVAPDAAPGPRDVLFHDAQGAPHLAPDLFTVTPAGVAPSPYITSSFVVLPPSGQTSGIVAPGSGLPYAVFGEFLQEGATITVSGEGVTVGSIQFVEFIPQNFAGIVRGARLLLGVMVVDEDAPTGFRDVTVRNPDGTEEVLVNMLAVARDPAAGPFPDLPENIFGGGGGCSTAPAGAPGGALLALASLLLFFAARRRPR